MLPAVRGAGGARAAGGGGVAAGRGAVVVSERDEAAAPEDEVAAVLEQVLGGRAGTLGLRVQFTDRVGRSEKITLLFPEGGTITVSANTTKAGASRRALIAFLERCEAIGKQVQAEVAAEREAARG